MGRDVLRSQSVISRCGKPRGLRGSSDLESEGPPWFGLGLLPLRKVRKSWWAGAVPGLRRPWAGLRRPTPTFGSAVHRPGKGRHCLPRPFRASPSGIYRIRAKAGRERGRLPGPGSVCFGPSSALRSHPCVALSSGWLRKGYYLSGPGILFRIVRGCLGLGAVQSGQRRG